MGKKSNDDMNNSIAATIANYYPVSVENVKYAHDRLLSWDKTITAIEMSYRSGLSLFYLVTAGMDILAVNKDGFPPPRE